MQLPVDFVLFICMLCVMAEYCFVQHLVNVQLCSQYLNLTDLADIGKYCDRNQSAEVKDHINADQLSTMLIYNLLLFSFPLITITMGASWSDSFGRRLTMLIPTVGSLIVQAILFISAQHLGQSYHLYMVWICAAISGLTGTSAAIVVSCHGYVCERVESSKLTARMTWLETSLFFGGFVGSNLAARMLKTFDLEQQFHFGFATIAICHTINVLYIVFCVQKSQNQSTCSLKELFKLDHLKQVWVTISKRRSNSINGGTFALLYLCSFLSFCSLSAQTFLMFVYVRDPPFNWTAAQYADYSAFSFLTNGFALVFIFPVFSYFVKRVIVFDKEEPIDSNQSNSQVMYLNLSSNRSSIKLDLIFCMFGLLSKVAGLIMLGFAFNTLTLYSVPIISMLNEFLAPSIRSILSKLVDKEEKGKVLSIVSLLQSCSFVFGSIAFYFIYKNTLWLYSGFTFHLVAAFQVIGIFIIGYLSFKLRK